MLPSRLLISTSTASSFIQESTAPHLNLPECLSIPLSSPTPMDQNESSPPNLPGISNFIHFETCSPYRGQQDWHTNISVIHSVVATPQKVCSSCSLFFEQSLNSHLGSYLLFIQLSDQRSLPPRDLFHPTLWEQWQPNYTFFSSLALLLINKSYFIWHCIFIYYMSLSLTCNLLCQGHVYPLLEKSAWHLGMAHSCTEWIDGQEASVVWP